MGKYDEEKFLKMSARMEELLQKGTLLGGMDFLSDEEKAEFKTVSNAVYEWECELEPHPWRTKPSVILAIKKAIRSKGYKQKEAAAIVGVSQTMFSDILHGRKPLNLDIARNLYHYLGVSPDSLLA